MAPTSGHEMPINTKTFIVIVAVLAAVAWLWLSNMPPAQPQQPKVVRVNATSPPPPQPQTAAPTPATSMGSLFMCRSEAYRTRGGVVICGVDMVTDQYVFIRSGWIWAANATIRFLGDISSCSFRLGVNMLHLNCTSPIMVAK